MDINRTSPSFWGKKLTICLITAGILLNSFASGMFFDWTWLSRFSERGLVSENYEGLSITQGNSLMAPSNPSLPLKVDRKVKMIVTAYSSTPWETDDTPFITASGESVRKGIVANNLLPFGTMVRIPEVYGDDIFVVKDRMNSRKGYYHLDIWFSSSDEAKNFGAKDVYVEVLEG